MYELPDNMPELVLGDGLLSSLGTEAEDFFNTDARSTEKYNGRVRNRKN